MKNSLWLSGSRGFVGFYVKKKLLESGIDFKCISNKDGPGIIKIDFSDPYSIEKAISDYGAPETLIHLGWGNVYQPHEEIHVGKNLQEGKNIIDQFYSQGTKRIISVGSSSEYGDFEGALREIDFEPAGTVNNYVKGKLSLAKYGLSKVKSESKIFIHIRLFYTYGATLRNNSLIEQLYKNAREGNKMHLSPCLHFRDYINVLDAAEGIIKLSDCNFSGVVNLGSGNVIQLKSFVKLFWKETGRKEEDLVFGAHLLPEKEQNQPRAYADLTLLNELTGWVPGIDLEKGIRLTVSELDRIFL